MITAKSQSCKDLIINTQHRFYFHASLRLSGKSNCSNLSYGSGIPFLSTGRDL